MYRDSALWQKIRGRVLHDGASKRQVAREAGMSRKTLRKILAHEKPPGYVPRKSSYRKLGPYIPAIERFLCDPASGSITVQSVVSYLRANERFVGSYGSVRNYLLRRSSADRCDYENAYELITTLPKTRAIEIIRGLTESGRIFLSSRRLRSLMRNSELVASPYSRTSRELRRISDIDWIRRIASGAIDDRTLLTEFTSIPDFQLILRNLRNGRSSHRTRALIVLARTRRIPIRTIAECLRIDRRTIRAAYANFLANGAASLFERKRRSKTKIDDPNLHDAIFGLIHEPPSNHGINRTTWTLKLLRDVLNAKNHRIGSALISTVLRRAGYTWRKAKVVLTSNDPLYREKLNSIHGILSKLRPDEAFFSIDEYGPFAIKAKAGRQLVPPGIQPTVPQWQKSRGCLIVTAAIELSSNQTTHFYSLKKNTEEMIRMLDRLIEQYADRHKLYLSWDAASWHISKRLQQRIDKQNALASASCGPLVELAPLPAGAQFLNVIEAIFSGMARAIIHNSDYKSVDDAKAAIDRYFAERNAYFAAHPKRAGNKLWGKEPEVAMFSEANNCKDSRYR